VSPTPPPPTGRREWLGLLIVLLVAAALRLPHLATNPPGLIPDEAMFTYDAWSILKTGRDQYGERLPLFPRSAARLHSMYLYATVPSVAVFGLTELGARVPAVLAGLLTVALVSRLVRRSAGVAGGLAASALLAVSPWHVLISRTGHEWIFLPTVTLVTALLVLRAIEGRGRWWLAGVAAGLCLYTYTPVRLSMPLVMLGIALAFRRPLLLQWRRVAIAVGVSAVVALPVVVSAFAPEGLKRLAVVRDKGESGDSLAGGFVVRYARSFSPTFLLAGTREPALHRLRSTGLLYGFEALLLALGVVSVLRRRDPVGLMLLFWWAATPFAVAIHRDCPDPVLLVTQLPAPQALAGIGVGTLLALTATLRHPLRILVPIAAGLVALVPLTRMVRDLYTEFPVYAAPIWSYGLREAVHRTEALRAGFDDVLVEGRQKLIYSLILFYARLDPNERQREVADLEGLAYRSRVGPYRIGNVGALLRTPGRHLVWSMAGSGEPASAPPLYVVRWPDGSDELAIVAPTP
jgi:4-amino-4-deoxy-L-arabinose transferase-like glycosyltransferase